MTKWKQWLNTVCAGGAAAITIAFLLVGTLALANDNAAVLAANAQFYAALNKMFTGDIVPIKAIWSHADDVTYMGPTGKFEHGWSSVLKDWEGQAAMKLGGRVKPADIHAIVGRDVAVVSDYEEGENTNAAGKVARLRLRATNIFRKEHGNWKMVGHHTDLLPYLKK
jgi:ketosteroid isomerase-like protein